MALLGHFRAFRKNREKVKHITFEIDLHETTTVCVKQEIDKQDTSGV
jgi:adenine-specific DNA methylase